MFGIAYPLLKAAEAHAECKIAAAGSLVPIPIAADRKLTRSPLICRAFYAPSTLKNQRDRLLTRGLPWEFTKVGSPADTLMFQIAKPSLCKQTDKGVFEDTAKKPDLSSAKPVKISNSHCRT
jgi:hypothetical protein